MIASPPRAPGQDSRPLLRIAGVAVQRGASELLRDVELSVAPGEVLHLAGPNGCGKTSLLEVMAGLRPVAAGEVECPERPLWVGHRNGLNLALSLEANLDIWCRLHDAPRCAVPDALRDLGLYRLRRRSVRGLSAGQRRRGALATLRLGGASLWLLDEPLAALDADSVPLVAAMVRTHAERGGAVVLTTHQPLPDVDMREINVRAWAA